MKRSIQILILLLFSTTAYCQVSSDQADWDMCNEFYGKDGVRLKLKLVIYDKILNDNWDLHFDNCFENNEACSDYFQKEFSAYPYDNPDKRVDIDISYVCTPCLEHANKKLTDQSKKNKSSRIPNFNKAKEARACFSNNSNSYNDFINALGGLSENIYLDKVTCSGGKIYPEWSKRDENGKIIPVPDSERKPIDDLYAEMKEKSNARQVNEFVKQLKTAQTTKEAKELFEKIKEIADEINQNKTSDEYSSHEKFSGSITNKNSLLNSESGILSKETKSDGTTVLMLDTDKDGIADTRSTTKPGEAPVYEFINDSPSSAKFNKYESRDGASVVENLNDNGEIISSVRVYDNMEIVEREDGSAVYRFDTNQDGNYDKQTEFSPQGGLISEYNSYHSDDSGSDLPASKNNEALGSNPNKTDNSFSEPKITEQRPELSFSTASEMAEIASSFSHVDHNETLEPLQTASTIEEYYNAAKAIFGFTKDPQNVNKASAAYNSSASILLEELSGPSGFMYGKTIEPILETEFETFDESIDQLLNLLNNREADPNAAIRPVSNYVEEVGLPKHILNYLLNDLKNSNQ